MKFDFLKFRIYNKRKGDEYMIKDVKVQVDSIIGYTDTGVEIRLNQYKVQVFSGTWVKVIQLPELLTLNLRYFLRQKNLQRS